MSRKVLLISKVCEWFPGSFGIRSCFHMPLRMLSERIDGTRLSGIDNV